MSAQVKSTLPAPVQLLLFDVDGTVADTDPLHARAWQEAVSKQVGRELFSVEEYLNACESGVFRPRDFIESRLGAFDYEKLSVEKMRHFELACKGLEARPGFLELYRRAVTIGLPLGFVSSSSRASVVVVLRALLRMEPSLIVAREDVAHGKPDPQPYETAMHRAGCSHDVVAFEDSLAGSVSARKAGAKVYLMANPRGTGTRKALMDFRNVHIQKRATGFQVCLLDGSDGER